MSADAVTGDQPRRSSQEAWYELLLRAYPAGYRAAHGAELIGTLMQASAPGQRIPSLREAVGLVIGGFTARARRAVESPTPWWAMACIWASSCYAGGAGSCDPAPPARPSPVMRTRDPHCPLSAQMTISDSLAADMGVSLRNLMARMGHDNERAA
jgi:hypothetical protein